MDLQTKVFELPKHKKPSNSQSQDDDLEEQTFVA